MHRPVRILTLGAAAALTVLSLAGPSSAGSGPQAQMAVKCDLTITQQRNLGTTYVITIRQRGTTCANARKVVKAYHRCRRRHGGRDGRCPNRVYGYRCEERRYNRLRSGGRVISYDANARCKKGEREVFQKYQQDL